MSQTRRNLRAVLLSLCLVACGDDTAEPSSDAGPDDGGHADGADGSDAGDAPAADAESCFADLVAPSTGWLEVQRFRSADDTRVLWRARERTEEPTVGETSAYKLVRVWVETPDQPGTCLHESDPLDYQWAHHNWDEKWGALIGFTRYEVRELFTPSDTGAGWTDTLTLKDLDGPVLEGPLALVDAGCTSLPYDLNVCQGRMRLDEPPPGWE